MTVHKQSSARTSKLASKYLRMTHADLHKLTLERLFTDLRILAASVLSQDETPDLARRAERGETNL